MGRGRTADELRAIGFAADPERARQAGAKGTANREAKRRAGGKKNLTPFNSETGRAAALKSVEVRRARAEEQRVDREIAKRLRATFDRTTLGDDALVCAHSIIQRVQAGEIPVRHAGDAASWVKALVDIGRLEKGEATSLQAHVTADLGDLERQIARDMEALGIRSPGEIDAAVTTLSSTPHRPETDDAPLTVVEVEGGSRQTVVP